MYLTGPLGLPAPDRRCERQLASRRPTPQRQSQRGSFVSHLLSLLAMLGVGGSSLSDPFSPGLGRRMCTARRMCMVLLVPLTWTLPRTPYTVDACDGAPPEVDVTVMGTPVDTTCTGTPAVSLTRNQCPQLPPMIQILPQGIGCKAWCCSGHGRSRDPRQDAVIVMPTAPPPTAAGSQSGTTILTPQPERLKK